MNAARAALRRPYPGTAVLVLALLVAAFVTDTFTGSLTGAWLHRVGFAPRDLWELELGRLLVSALVTHGPRVLLGAVLMSAVSVGLLERQVGGARALAVFWGVHVATVVGLALVLAPLHGTLQSRLTEALLVIRDVGPSAGYFGALGAGLSVISGRTARGVALGVLAWLLLTLTGVIRLGPELPQSLSADLVHLAAFPSGWVVGRIWRQDDRQ